MSESSQNAGFTDDTNTVTIQHVVIERECGVSNISIILQANTIKKVVAAQRSIAEHRETKAIAIVKQSRDYSETIKVFKALYSLSKALATKKDVGPRIFNTRLEDI